MPLHRDSTLENIHRHHRWEVNNQAGLDALVPDALDIHKVAYKKDDDTYHVLKSVSPAVWVQTAYTKAKVDELLELKQDILTEGAFIDGDKTKLDNIEDGATADQTASEIKTAYESNDDTNALTDSLLALLTTKKVKNVTTDAVNDKLVITYTDDTVANLNINDIVTDVHVSGATLDATTNVLTLTSTDGGADVTVDLSDFVNSGELTSALSGKADNIHSHSTSDITGLDTTLSNLTTDLSDKQEILVSGTNIKTINGQSVLGSGDITISDATYVDNTIIDQIGLIDYGYVAKAYHIVAFGGEFNRADYPLLWDYLEANPSLVKTEIDWQTETTANGGICGFFSDGNGTTTFRVPNLDEAFLRPDSRGVGTYQGDEFKSHSHAYAVPAGAAVTPVANSSTTARHLDATGSTALTGGEETRPKNIAVLPLIVAK